MGEVSLELRVARDGAGWRGSVVVPTSAGRITLASEVPADAIRALRRELGPRGAEDSPDDVSGFLPVFGVIAAVYKLARKYGPVVIRAFRKYGPRVVGIIRRQGIKGLLRLVRGGLGGVAQSAIRRAVSAGEVPPALAAGLAGAYATTGALVQLPGLSQGVRESAELAGRILDAAVAARMGDRSARAWLARCARDPRCRPALSIAGALVER